MNPFTYQRGDGIGAHRREREYEFHSAQKQRWYILTYLKTLLFAEAYLEVAVHREGQGGVLRCLLGMDPEWEDAGHPQQCHPGDLTGPRALRPRGKGRKVRAWHGSPSQSFSPYGFQSSHLGLCGDRGCCF